MPTWVAVYACYLAISLLLFSRDRGTPLAVLCAVTWALATLANAFAGVLADRVAAQRRPAQAMLALDWMALAFALACAIGSLTAMGSPRDPHLLGWMAAGFAAILAALDVRRWRILRRIPTRLDLKRVFD